jgi:hypothetical protein
MVFILSSSEQKFLTQSQRLKIETRLAGYNIPLQILNIVADRCDCSFDTRFGRNDMPKKPKLATLFAKLNDKAIRQLEQIFLDCDDSFSGFRFAVFLSSMYATMMHKFVMDDEITVKSGMKYSLDVGIYSRNKGNLVAVGVQNNSQQAANSDSLQKFLAVAMELRSEIGIRGAYYSSSYGYVNDNRSLWRLARKMNNSSEKVEIKFFNYRDKLYYEITKY